MGRLPPSPAPSAPPPEPRSQRPASKAPPQGPASYQDPPHATPPPGALPKEALDNPLGLRFCLPHSDRPRKGIFG